jgi:hypothetical protein
VSKSNKLPPEIVDHWPEIFEDIEIKAIPLQYVKAINIHFSDGTTWIIDIKTKSINQNIIEDLEDELEALFDEYDDMIETVDFNLDAQKVKKDISSLTKSFIKKRK